MAIDIESPGADEADLRAALNALTSGRLIATRIITATGAGTYTPTSGTSVVEIELVGGGGGGGGSAAPGSGNIAAARGGGGGAICIKRLSANFAGASYSVGAKGGGGAAGNNAGSAGGSTTFTDTAGSPTVYTAGGGAGGSGGGAVSTFPSLGGGMAAGGSSTNGDINVPGWPSAHVFFALSATQALSGAGANNRYGAGGGSVSGFSNASTAGNNASGKGAGGSGACCTGTGVAKAGGDGADGMIIIREYSA